MSVLVTGAGAVASVGSDLHEVFDGLFSGRSGRAPLRAFARGRFGADHAYEIRDRPAGGGDMPGRATGWLIRAVREAVEEAGLNDDLADVPVLVGTGLRELRSAELRWRDGTEFGVDELHFGTALRERFGAWNTYTMSNACSASLHALSLGVDLLNAGEADAVVVAGVDSITESMYGLLDRVQLEPPESVQPFARDRKGVLMGDGAAAVVLRRDEAAFRTATRGRVRAVGVNCDAHHVTAPEPSRIEEAIRQAHAKAGVKAEDLDLVVLHGTGTALNDVAEARAVGAVFGTAAGVPLMTALKSMTGHTSGGSGLLSLVVALQAINTGWVPPVGQLGQLIDEAQGFRFAGEAAASARMSLAQVNAFGFGGVNAVAVVEGVPA